MNWDRLEQARESLCGWSGCEDCQFLREAIAEIERLRSPDGRLAVMLSVDHVEREATGSFINVEEDLQAVADACYLAWTEYTEQEKHNG